MATLMLSNLETFVTNSASQTNLTLVGLAQSDVAIGQLTSVCT